MHSQFAGLRLLHSSYARYQYSIAVVMGLYPSSWVDVNGVFKLFEVSIEARGFHYTDLCCNLYDAFKLKRYSNFTAFS